jgi:hypothetical protein
MKDEDLFWAKKKLYTKQNKWLPAAEHQTLASVRP